MIFCSYLDDSSDQTQSKVIVSASFIGTVEQWAELRKAWSAKLKEHGISYYKSSEQRMLRGQFQKFQSETDYPRPYGRQAAEKIRTELEKIVDDVKIGGMGIVVPVRVFDEVSSDSVLKEKMRWNPYQLVLQTLFHESVKEIKIFPGHHKVSFVHDEGSNCSQLHELYLGFKRKNPKTAKYMAGFSCLDDKLHPPLQCADMIANTTTNYALQWLADPTAAQLKRLKESLLRICVWDKDYMTGVIGAQK
jgi:hypothetical protein